MRRLVLTVTASAVVLAIAPASALARHGHHKRHHSRSHHARVHVRHRRFGDIATPPATTPAPATPAAAPADAVGKVASFDGTKLTITLNDGTTNVSGKVTPDTEIECEAMETSSGTMHPDGDGGDESSGDNSQGDDSGRGDDNDRDDQGENNDRCTTANLIPGTFVRGAELELSSAGASWDKVDLIL
jgi:hypothetical protein